MAAAAGKAQFCVCCKEKSACKCTECSKDIHLTEDHETLTTELGEIENDNEQFEKSLTKKKEHLAKKFLIEQIDEWENDSINKIKQRAEECRKILLGQPNKIIDEIEKKLIELADEMKEIDLKRLKTKLTEQLIIPTNISIQQDTTPPANEISGQTPHFPQIDLNTKWKQNGITVAGGNGRGDGSKQLWRPEAIYVDDDNTVHIADRNNHRIIEWGCGEKKGRVVAGGNEQGRGTDQLNQPTYVLMDKKDDSLIISDWKNRRIMRWSRRNATHAQIITPKIECWGLAMDNNGDLYVADTEKHEVRRWKIEGDTDGRIVAGGNGEGSGLNQLKNPSHIFVDKDYSVYVSDSDNYRVVKWMKDTKEGIVVAGGKGKGNSLTQLSTVRGLFVDHLGQVYVVDYGNHRVMRFREGISEGTIVVGGNGYGAQPNQFKNPIGLSFDRQGNLYVVDRENHRIQRFEID